MSLLPPNQTTTDARWNVPLAGKRCLMSMWRPVAFLGGAYKQDQVIKFARDDGNGIKPRGKSLGIAPAMLFAPKPTISGRANRLTHILVWYL